VSTICLIVGARPNFMKVAPVHLALHKAGRDLLLVHTGQHYDREMSDVFVDETGLPEPDLFLGTGSGTHAEQTARVLIEVEKVLAERRPAIVVVPGDVNSTLAAALASVKLGIPVAHLEAGLRSRDWSMPEEHNRRLTDHVSKLLLATSSDAVENLASEGIHDGVVLVGNTMIDSVLACRDKAVSDSPWQELGLDEGTYALVTLHRPALVDDPERLGATVKGLLELATELPVVFAVHPRTRDRLVAAGLTSPLEQAGVVLTPPLSYLGFLGLEARARLVLTDSGGVQEETSALGVRCFTLRDTTERPVTVTLGTNTLLGASPERIAEIPALLRDERVGQPIPLWDGAAGPRAAAAIIEAAG
jgi:UDP-N-acetylglucosamine 2-epimerase (non-hydrolysing)